MASERVLSQRELNRALLARQLLLERAAVSLPKALERVAGLQAQYAPSMYIGLWSRVTGFRRDDLTRALERRRVIQGTLMRATIHLVSPRDYWPFAIAIRSARQAWYVRVQRGGPTVSDYATAAARLRKALGDDPIHRRQLEEIVGKGLANGVGLWLDLVRAPPSGTWERRRADLFAAADDWLPRDDVAPAAALDHLVRRYLRGFGPAAPNEIADWAGLPPADVTEVLGRLRLRRFRTETGQKLVDVPGAPIPAAETPAPVRFLPTFDATMLVHVRRTGILPEEHRPLIFNIKNPQSVPTFLVDGVVAGTWRYLDGRVQVDPFGRLDGATRRALREEADRLEAFHE